MTIKELTSRSVILMSSDDSEYEFDRSLQSMNKIIKLLKSEDSMYLWEDKIKPLWVPTSKLPYSKKADVSEQREQIRTNIKMMCKQRIVSGVYVDVGLIDADGSPRGELHYPLTERNQSDISELAHLIERGATKVTYRDDSRVTHEIYTSEQFMKLHSAALMYIFRCRLHSDELEALLDSYSDDELDSMKRISWDIEIPQEISKNTEELWSTMYPDVEW